MQKINENDFMGLKFKFQTETQTLKKSKRKKIKGFGQICCPQHMYKLTRKTKRYPNKFKKTQATAFCKCGLIKIIKPTRLIKRFEEFYKKLNGWPKLK